MGAPRYVVIEGKPYLWRELLRIRREQRNAERTAQSALFELKEDVRPSSQATAQGRYAEPLLFD